MHVRYFYVSAPARVTFGLFIASEPDRRNFPHTSSILPPSKALAAISSASSSTRPRAARSRPRRLPTAAPHLALGVTRLPHVPHRQAIGPRFDVEGLQVVRELAPDVMHGHGAKGGTFARLAGTLLSTARQAGRPALLAAWRDPAFRPAEPCGRLFFGIERLLELACDGLVHVSRYEAEAYLDKVGKASCGASHRSSTGCGRTNSHEVIPKGHAQRHRLYGDDARPERTGRAASCRRQASRPHRPGPDHRHDRRRPGPRRYRRLAGSRAGGRRLSFATPCRRGGACRGPARRRAVAGGIHALHRARGGCGRDLRLLASKVGGIPEILGPRSGQLVPPGDVDALADEQDDESSNYKAPIAPIGQVVAAPSFSTAPSTPRTPAPGPLGIDPGHGGCLNWGVPDPRQRGVRYSEKTMTLAIAQQLQAMLQAQGVTVVMTREQDVALAGDDYPALGCHGPPWRDVNGDGESGFDPEGAVRTRDELQGMPGPNSGPARARTRRRHRYQFVDAERCRLRYRSHRDFLYR